MTDARGERTVLCMKWGTKYGPEYVNRLYAMVRRHLKGDFRFVCLTERSEGIVPDVQCLPIPPLDLPPGIPERGWTKLTTFAADLHGLQGTALFLDLDVVIVGDITPLFEAHKDFVLGSRVLHGDETTVALLDPGAGKTKTAYMWAYARGVFDPEPGVVYDFCTGRGSQFPYKFLGQWTGTLVRDGYVGYEKALLLEDRFDAGCMAHSRRKFDELFKANASPVAAQAIQRIAWLYRIEADARDLTAEQRLKMRQERSRPLCEELHIWLQLERRRVPDGSGIANAIDYSLNRWAALTRFLLDGDVPIDNNHLENQMRPWAQGRKNWLFVGSELAGERAAMIMSLLQSAKLNKADPWAYLKDVLTRLPTQLNSRIDELLPHRWKPAT